SHLLAYMEHNGNEKDVTTLKRVSPVAWQHINLYGRYEFSQGPKDIDRNAIIQELSQLPVKPELAESSLEYTFSRGYAKIPKLQAPARIMTCTKS
ncbi:Tn3 family transposase, partial [Candidatus Poribacteria bacterium]|nr:Tn3 family transposase [Candidatus Poribacteria bacterium]